MKCTDEFKTAKCTYFGTKSKALIKAKDKATNISEVQSLMFKHMIKSCHFFAIIIFQQLNSTNHLTLNGVKQPITSNLNQLLNLRLDKVPLKINDVRTMITHIIYLIGR